MYTKYFADIIGHKQIVEALQRAFTNRRVAHAYLFSGAEGIGKYKVARAFAHMLQCTCSALDVCLPCLACDLANGKTHPDIVTIIPQGSTIRIEQIREIQKDVQFNPRAGNRKIFIIDGVEQLTPQAANCLLKVLEEPPLYVVFMLLTTKLHSVLPTLLSRCQHLPFHALTETDMVAFLTQRGLHEQAGVIAAVSGGVPGRALIWAESGHMMREQVINCLAALQTAPCGQIWDVVAVLDQEREQILTIFELLSIILRDCLVWKATENRALLLYRDCAGRIASLAERAALDGLLAVYKELENSKVMLLGNANTRLLWERLCLRLQDVLVVQGGSY